MRFDDSDDFREAAPADFARPLRAMIAASDPDERRRLRSALEREHRGWRLIDCDLDDRIIDRARHWHPDLLVVDWDEAPVNAFELSEAARCWPELRRTRVVALSAEGGRTADPEVALLRRPFGASALEESVGSVLRESRALRRGGLVD